MLSTAENSNRMNWQNLWLRVQSLGFVMFAGIVAVGVALFLFLPALRTRHNMQAEIERLDAEIIRQENLEKQQRQEIESLKTDPPATSSTSPGPTRPSSVSSLRRPLKLRRRPAGKRGLDVAPPVT
jgi:hypothetical protein